MIECREQDLLVTWFNSVIWFRKLERDVVAHVKIVLVDEVPIHWLQRASI
jgi:hypothetical protein